VKPCPNCGSGPGQPCHPRCPRPRDASGVRGCSVKLPPHVPDEQRVLGALVRGTLAPRDVEGWLPTEGDGRVGRAFGQLHRELYCAVLASREALGRVDLRRVIALLGPSAGVVHEGRLLGYLPELARRAPARREALWALELARQESATRRARQEAVAGAFRALGRGIARVEPDKLGAIVLGTALELRQWDGRERPARAAGR